MSRAAKKEILRVIDDYRAGRQGADGVLLRSAFHMKAVVIGYLGSRLIMADPPLFIEEITSAPSVKSNSDDYGFSVDKVFIQGDTASVIVTETGLPGGLNLVDYFHLIYDDGMWSIISMLFTTY